MRAGMLLLGASAVAGGGCSSPSGDSGAAPLTLTAVTFNTGTTEGLDHGGDPDDGYDADDALISDTWYGDGLAWVPAVEATAAWFDDVSPDIVGFQEIFWSDACADIPAEAHDGFVCETWQAGDPTVAQAVLGADYQVACHPGKPDKCIAVHARLGRIAGCADDFCLEGLDGTTVDGCGSGSRVARARVELVDGDTLTVAHVHGSSGLNADDQACRVAQVEQLFVDLGDGAPAADGGRNLVLGDLNTDPGQWAAFDTSAARWNDFVGADRSFAWITDVGEDAEPTYAGVANIDHVASDVATGSCWHAGITQGPPVIDAVYFDHAPAVCTLSLP